MEPLVSTLPSPSYLARENDYSLIKQLMAKRIAYHLCFWTVIFCYNTLYLGFLWNDYANSFYEFVLILPFYIGITYLNLYYFIPKYLANQQIGTYLILLLISVAVVVVSFQIVIHQLVTVRFCPDSYKAHTLFDGRFTIKQVFYTIALVGLATGIKLTKGWIEQRDKLQVIERQNVKNELEFLKSQIQPHFFFNTLNNLYSLTVRKSDLAPEVVLKLSDLMSYMLYESDNAKTTLRKELEHIQNYLDLESLRFGDRLHLDFQVVGATESHSVPPLILLPFIENAFKHGTSHETGELNLTIFLQIKDKNLLFEITNPRFESKANRKKHKGLGLKNVTRRLDLLYGKNYTLSIQPTGNQYHISLKLPL